MARSITCVRPSIASIDVLAAVAGEPRLVGAGRRHRGEGDGAAALGGDRVLRVGDAGAQRAVAAVEVAGERGVGAQRGVVVFAGAVEAGRDRGQAAQRQGHAAADRDARVAEGVVQGRLAGRGRVAAPARGPREGLDRGARHRAAGRGAGQGVVDDLEVGEAAGTEVVARLHDGLEGRDPVRLGVAEDRGVDLGGAGGGDAADARQRAGRRQRAADRVEGAVSCSHSRHPRTRRRRWRLPC